MGDCKPALLQNSALNINDAQEQLTTVPVSGY